MYSKTLQGLDLFILFYFFQIHKLSWTRGNPEYKLVHYIYNYTKPVLTSIAIQHQHNAFIVHNN